MTTNATAAPPSPTAARRYSENMSVLLTRQVRELIAGLAAIDAPAGIRPREGEAVRDMLDEAIARLYETDPDRYAKAMRRGRSILKQRDAERRASE